MSNHSGSYMLNEILETLDEFGVFSWLGTEKTQQLIWTVLKIGSNYDCNRGEILEEVGRKVGICSRCTRAAPIVYKDLCQLCLQAHYGVDENGDISLSQAGEEWGYTQTQLLKWLKAENVAYYRKGSQYFANFIALKNCIDKRSWNED